MDTTIQALGMMSGSSLDGLDLCVVAFSGDPLSPQWNIIEAETVHIPNEMKDRLIQSPSLSGDQLLALDVDYGRWMGGAAKAFLQKRNLAPAFAAVHGHTVFHRPAEGWSYQLGSAIAMNQKLGIPIIDNFRNYDMVLGGQGAPLVPMGDLGLFPAYDAWINLGGICNLTLRQEKGIVAGDVGPMNQVMNHVSARRGKPFDEGGSLASAGRVQDDLALRMKAWPYFQKPFPKSLGNEDVRAFWFDLLGKASPEDELATFAYVMAGELAAVLNAQAYLGAVLVSGGGAYNSFFVQQLHELTQRELVVADDRITSFKEALVFAYLGWLRTLHVPNALPQATGAKKAAIMGTITK